MGDEESLVAPLAAGAACRARAGAWPERPITLLHGFGPGGSADVWRACSRRAIGEAWASRGGGAAARARAATSPPPPSPAPRRMATRFGLLTGGHAVAPPSRRTSPSIRWTASASSRCRALRLRRRGAGGPSGARPAALLAWRRSAPGRVDLRLGRHRIDASPGRRDAGRDGRRADGARALSRRRGRAITGLLGGNLTSPVVTTASPSSRRSRAAGAGARGDRAPRARRRPSRTCRRSPRRGARLRGDDLGRRWPRRAAGCRSRAARLHQAVITLSEQPRSSAPGWRHWWTAGRHQLARRDAGLVVSSEIARWRELIAARRLTPGGCRWSPTPPGWAAIGTQRRASPPQPSLRSRCRPAAGCPRCAASPSPRRRDRPAASRASAAGRARRRRRCGERPSTSRREARPRRRRPRHRARSRRRSSAARPSPPARPAPARSRGLPAARLVRHSIISDSPAPFGPAMGSSVATARRIRRRPCRPHPRPSPRGIGVPASFAAMTLPSATAAVAMSSSSGARAPAGMAMAIGLVETTAPCAAGPGHQRDGGGHHQPGHALRGRAQREMPDRAGMGDVARDAPADMHGARALRSPPSMARVHRDGAGRAVGIQQRDRAGRHRSASCAAAG